MILNEVFDVSQRQSTVMVDIDGTILESPSDYFTIEDDVTPITSVCNIVQRLYDRGLSVIFLTARAEDTRELSKKHIDFCIPGLNGDYKLFMRSCTDDRPSPQMKIDRYLQDIELDHDIVLFLDNEPENIAVFNELGLNAVQC